MNEEIKEAFDVLECTSHRLSCDECISKSIVTTALRAGVPAANGRCPTCGRAVVHNLTGDEKHYPLIKLNIHLECALKRLGLEGK